MDQLPDYINPIRLVISNFPKDFRKSETRKFLEMFGAIDVKSIGRSSAVAEFTNARVAKEVLEFLHQLPLENRLLSVVYDVRKHLIPTDDSEEQQNESENQQNNSERLNQFIEKLNATNEHLNFTQPPPPYLKYLYPKINRDIVDAIHIALESSTMFYTQVLHLMNRMNLEPPFEPTSKKLLFPTMTRDAAIQTGDVDVLHSDNDNLASDESELDTPLMELPSKDELTKLKKRRFTEKSKTNLKKFRKIIETSKVSIESNSEKAKQISNSDLHEVFDFNEKLNRNITIQAPSILQPSVQQQFNVTIMESKDSNKTDDRLTDAEIKANRLPSDQMKTHPLFQNYNPGQPSNKLYIKNLAKSVTEDDLRQIYLRYVNTDDSKHIDIRLMKTGRMKGQAFITFTMPYLDDSNYEIVSRALAETNGYILKDKIMVVFFGKS